MKEIRILTISLFAVLLASCSIKETSPEQGGPQKTISASIDSDKISLVQGDSKLELAWEEGDKLRVIGQNSAEYAIQPDFTAHSARFSGTEVTGSPFSVIYPGTYKTVDEVYARNYNNQTQIGNGTTGHLEFNAIAEGLTDYSSVSFSSSNPAVKLNGAMKFVIKLPQGVNGVSSLQLIAESDVFFYSNSPDSRTDELNMYFDDCDLTEAGGVLTAYMMTSWQKLTLMRGSILTIRVRVEGKSCYYEHNIETKKTIDFLGGKCFVIDLSSSVAVHHISGSGTAEDPYIIYDMEDLNLMPGKLTQGKTTYMLLGADIDMQGQTWNPFTPTAGHTKAIDFNGGGCTIKNFSQNSSSEASFFGELNGKVSNVIFENPSVQGSGECGIVCSRLGSSASQGVVNNVKIVNPTVSTTLSSSNTGAGVVVGSAIKGTIENVTVSHGTLTVGGSATASYVGGIVGCDNSVDVSNVRADTVSVVNNISNTATDFSSATATGGVIGCLTGGATVEKSSFIGGSITAASQYYIGGILGMTTASTEIINCTSKTDISGTGKWYGGIAGYSAGSIEMCASEGSISGAQYLGGIAGQISEGSSINNCCSKSDITCSSQFAGGIVGEAPQNTTITTCYSSGNIKGGRACGGIIGRMSNSTSTASGKDYGNVVKYCIAWNPSINAGGTTSQYSSGVIVGFTGTKNTFVGNYRRPDVTFSCSGKPSGVSAPVDQGATTSSITKGIASSYWYPYHGDATAEPTVSAVAKSLNKSETDVAWDTEVWDLSGDFPVLTGAGGSGGGGGDEPVPTPGVNPGSDWTKTTVADGVDYYYFHKSYSGNMQSVHVTCVDLNSGKWALKLAYDRYRHIDSDILKTYDAVASMNGGYEEYSIVIKKDAVLYWNIQNSTIGDSGVPNWKNEGAICFDGGNNVSFNAAGMGQTLDVQRKVYKAMPDNNIISSAPVLILDHEQLGTTFCSRYSGSKWGSGHESPSSHQSSSYPRTAIGITDDNHLLLVVVDGRFSDKAVGMSASTLTKFMVKYFHPKDLLNLDGGGSSTMCVKGLGDSQTHVVNYPCDDGAWNHSGERDVTTHFYIVAQ